LNADYEISDQVLHHIALGTAAKSGQSFFYALVEHTAKALQADMVFITECIHPHLSEVRTLAHWYKGALAENFDYETAQYPCTHVIQGNIYIQTTHLLEDYPDEVDNMQSYIGIPLMSTKGIVLGHLVVMNEYTIDEKPKGLSALRIFAARAAVELERLQSETNLIQSEERYRLLFDTNPLPIFVFDVTSYEILAANRAALRVYGYSLGAFRGMRFPSLITKPYQNMFAEWLKQPLQPDQPWDCILEHHTKLGQTLTVQLSRRFIRFEGREACLSMVNDITERRRIESERDQAYQSLEQRVIERTHEIERRQQIAESLRDVLKTINSHCTINDVLAYITQQASTLLSADAVVTCQYMEDDGRCFLQAQHGLAIFQLASGDEPPGWELIRGRMGEHAPIAINSGKVTAKSGNYPPYQQQFQTLLAVPLRIREMAYGYLILYFLDPLVFSEEEIHLAVTFADQMALALENSHLRQEAEQLATYEERNRLARDLHDAVAQTLWSASLLADVIPALWKRDQDRALQRLEQLRQLNRVAHQEMRALLLGLRPKALTESGIDDLIRQLISTTTANEQLKIDFTVSGELVIIPAEVQIAYYRVAQEALNNVIRHAQASHVMIHLNYGDGKAFTLMMQVQDNGCGFDASAITSDHFGTKIMRERADSIGAQISVSSEVGYGTSIEMRWLDGNN